MFLQRIICCSGSDCVVNSTLMKQIWIRAKVELPHTARVRDILVPALEQQGFSVHSIDEALPTHGNPELCLCLGGDGTLLSTVRLLGEHRYQVPILGVHTSAGLGFLHTLAAPLGPKEALEWATLFARALAQKDYALEKRWGLVAWLGGNHPQAGERFWALNDVVISKGPLSRMIYLQVKVGDSVLMQHLRGDGLIVATATGSTGYSLSAGGPVVHPNLNTVLVTPICPHEVGQRPILLDGSSEILIESLMRRSPSYLTFDGQVKVDLGSGQTIHIQRCERPVNWVKLSPSELKAQNFFERLKSKLGYGGDLSNAP